MRLLLVAGLVAWCALSALPAIAQDPAEHPGEHHPGEFTTRMVIKDMFVQDVFLPQGVNLGNLTATSYKSGNDKSSGSVLVPGDLKINPIQVEIGWHDASTLIRWFKRTGEGKQEKRDIQLYVRHIDTQKNHVHVTLHNCWPSDVTLGPMGEHLPPVLVTIQAERVTTHLPPLLQTIPGGTVSE